jgi:serine/threonine-protein kinase
MSEIPADKNLLLGVVALQMDFISRDQLIAAVASWMRDKTKSLSKVLLENKYLDDETNQLLESLVDKFLGMHDNNVLVSFAKIGSIGSVRDRLAKLGDREVEATLDFVSGTRRELASETPNAATGGTSDQCRFHILHFHAEGGFGQVSLASDEELHRQVAFKELKPRFADDPVARTRFLMEAEITGRLEHPGIVPVYGLGHYGDGRPFYAMKFVRGDNLKTAIENFHDPDSPAFRNREIWNLEFRKLLGRFLDVCNAIQYAHSRGVLHRDLKPSNIMMGKFGETLVMDWGLAKIIGRPSTDRISSNTGEDTLRPVNASAGTATMEGSALGTPYYMSPEQAAGNLDDLGPATDVYSLGATLFHLLTGRPAFTEKDLDEVLVKVCRGDYPAPRDVNSRVPRALQSICLKAMALLPENRYETPIALAEDVEHWMADEPVSSHRESSVEKIGRWMRRHRTFVRIAGASLLAFAAISIIAAVLINNERRKTAVMSEKNQRLAEEKSQLAERESQARRHALERLKEARDAVDLWLTGASEAIKYTPNAQKARGHILLRAVEDYENFVKQDEEDFTLQLERGRTYLRLGDVWKMLARPRDAEDAYRKGETLLEKLEKASPDSIDASIELANCRTKLGILMSAGNSDLAEKYYDRARFGLRPLMQQHPDNDSLADALASNLIDYGTLLREKGRLPEAEFALREAAAIYEKLLRTKSKAAVRYRSGLSMAHGSLGRVFLDGGRYEDAASAFRQAIRCSDSALPQEAENPDFIANRIDLFIAQAQAFKAMGKFAEVSDAYRTAIEDYRKLVQGWPDIPTFSEGLGSVRSNYALLLLSIGRAKAAEVESRESRAIFDRSFSKSTDDVTCRYNRASSCDLLCQCLSELGRFDEAMPLSVEAREAAGHLAQTYVDEPEYLALSAITHTHAGQLFAKIGRWEESEGEFRAAIAALEGLTQSFPDMPAYRPYAVFTYYYQGQMFWKRDKKAEAGEAFNRAKQLWQDLTSTALDSESAYGFAWFLTLCPDEKTRDADLALEMAKRSLEKSPRNPLYLTALGGAYYRKSDWGMCISAVRQAMEQWPDGNAYGWFFLAMGQWQSGEKENARSSLQKGIRWMDDNCPEKSDLKLLRVEAETLIAANEEKSNAPDAEKK